MAISALGRQGAGRGRCSPESDASPAEPSQPGFAASFRVALIRQRWRPDGGAERQVSAFLEMLGGRLGDVTLITRDWSSTARYRILKCDPFPFGRVWREWEFARAARKLLARHEFDLVQSHERIAGCDVYRAGDGVHREWLRQKARTQTRIGRWTTSLSPYHVYVKGAERALFESPRLQAVICNSRMVRDEVLDWFAIDPAKLHVIHNGVDTQRFHPGLRRHRGAVRRRLAVPEEAPLFVFVGSGFQRKGLEVAVRAVAKTAGAYLAVVGKDKNAPRFERLARRLGMGGRLRLVGVEKDVGPYYGAADALVLPTLYDPFPNVVLEALASRLPVATSTKCGGAELVAEGENGYVRDALDVGGLADALAQLADPQRRASMGAAARASAEPFNVDATRRRLLEFYREVLDE